MASTTAGLNFRFYLILINFNLNIPMWLVVALENIDLYTFLKPEPFPPSVVSSSISYIYSATPTVMFFSDIYLVAIFLFLFPLSPACLRPSSI